MNREAPVNFTLVTPFHLSVHNANCLKASSGQTISVGTKKTLLVLVILAMRQGESVSRRALAQTVWPGAGERASRDSLRTALSALRRVLPSSALVADSDRVRLEPGFVALGTGFMDGEFMPDFDDDWVLERRLADRAKAVAALLEDARKRLGADDLEGARAAAERACARDPFSDQAAALRVELLERVGQRSEAAESSQAHRRRVLRELGTISDVGTQQHDATSPLWTTAEWLLERDSAEALAFLRSTGPHWEIAPAANSLELHRRALSQTDRSSRDWDAVHAQMLYIGWCLHGNAADFSAVESAYQAAIESGDNEIAFKLGVVLTYCFLSTGQFSRALAAAKSRYAAALEYGSANDRYIAELTLSIVHQHAGDPKIARRMMERLGWEAEDSPSLVIAGQRYLMAAQCALDDGDLAKCDSKLQRAKSAFLASAGERMLGFTDIMAAEILIASGDGARARDVLTGVLGRGADVVGHSATAMASDVLAEIDCRLGDFDLSAESLAKSRALRESLGTVASLAERRRLAPVKKKLVEKLGQDYLRRVMSRPRLAT